MTDDVLTMLADSAAAFAKPDLNRVRRIRNADPGFDERVWSQLAEQGWLSSSVPEAQGGLGLGTQASVIIARALGRAAFPEPFVPVAVMALTCLCDADDVTHWAERITALGTGKRTATVAWQGLFGGVDIGACDVVASEVGANIVLRGASRFVPLPSASAFIVAAKACGGIGLYWVECGSQGLAIETELCPDGSKVGHLRFDAVGVSRAACISRFDRGATSLRRCIDCALIANAAELVGIMDAVLEMTMAYLRTRRQFGVPIGSFQALQHRAVDIWIERQVAEAAVIAAARLLDDVAATATEKTAAASGAKARAAQAALHVCNESLQLHGAIGFTEEYGLGIYLNRALTLAPWLGSATQHRRRYGRLSRGESVNL
jgi:alkylation response protein AidB-like acyl-CoA dehydrogenase